MASITENALRRFGVGLGVGASKRLVEEKLEPILEEAIRSGMDDNETLRRLALATRDIPGLRVGMHAAVSAAGAILAEHADDLWPGRNDELTKRMRFMLKRLGPSLYFASDIGADALEKAVKDRVDVVASSSLKRPEDRKAEVDRGVYVFIHNGKRYVVIPLRLASGEVVFDADGDPVPSNDVQFWYDSGYTETTTKMEGTGKDRKQVSHKPRKRKLTPLLAIQDAVNMMGSEAIPWGDVESLKEELKKMAVKPSYFGSWGDDVWNVVRAYNATFARRKVQTGYDWLDQEESEGLVQTMLKAQPDVALLRELVGKRFKARIGHNGALPGELSLKDCAELEQVVLDMWLGGEQPGHVKFIRRARRIWRHSAMQGTNIPATLIAILSIVGFPVLVAVSFWVVGFLIALVMYSGAVTQPLGVSNNLLGYQLEGVQYVLVATIASSWMVFLLSQTLYSAILTGWDRESVESTARKIRIFGFLLPTLNGYIALLGGPVEARMTAVLAVGMTIGLGSMMVDAGYRYRVEEAIAKMFGPLNLILATIPLVLAFLWGPYLSYAMPVGVWFAALTMRHWVGLGALVVFIVLFLAFLFGKSKEGSGSGERAITLGSILGGFIFIAFLCDLGLTGLDKIGNWFDNDPAPAAVQAVTQSPPQQDDGPRFDKDLLCADPKVPVRQRKLLNCL